METIGREQAAPLVMAICRARLWATPEETAAWLKTETGRRIAALIEREREKELVQDEVRESTERKLWNEENIQNIAYYPGCGSH